MLFIDPKLFEQAAWEFRRHASHRLNLTPISSDVLPERLVIECDDCHEVLIEFLPEQVTEHPSPDHVKYEGHYEAVPDICWVEVFRPGKSSYPLQERQDLINHSPTGIAWGYGGSGPAQCAFAILMDYLGDEQRARVLYHDFKFSTIAKLSTSKPWALTGRQIELEIARIESRRRPS